MKVGVELNLSIDTGSGFDTYYWHVCSPYVQVGHEKSAASIVTWQ